MSCLCDFDYAWKVVSNRWCTARKDHECMECHRKIRPGERYLVTTGKNTDDNLLGHYATCETCGRVRTDLMENGGYCFLYGGLWDFVAEEFEPPEGEASAA